MPRYDDQTNDDILPQSERFQALSPEEYELLWGHPVFSDSDRALVFQLNAREQEHFDQLCTPKNQGQFPAAAWLLQGTAAFLRADAGPGRRRPGLPSGEVPGW